MQYAANYSCTEFNFTRTNDSKDIKIMEDLKRKVSALFLNHLNAREIVSYFFFLLQNKKMSPVNEEYVLPESDSCLKTKMSNYFF